MLTIARTQINGLVSLGITVRRDGDAMTGLARQYRFAASVALNRTVEEAHAVMRRGIGQRFIVRVPQFVYPPVQLPNVWRATVDRPSAFFALGDDEGGSAGIGARREAILTKFETGGRKTATNPSFPIAIPTKAIRPSPTALVPRALYPVNLRLAPRLDASGATIPALRRGKVRTLTGGVVASKKKRAALGLQGIGGTFTIGTPDRAIGVFQRVGRGRGAIRLIWAYRQSIPIPPRLHWVETAETVATNRLQPNFEGALEFALRTAR